MRISSEYNRRFENLFRNVGTVENGFPEPAAWEQIAHEADATYSREKAAALFQTLKKNGTWVTPTLASLDITSHPEAWKTDDPLLAFVPPAMSKQWRDSFTDERMKQRAAWLGRQASNDWKLSGELHRAGVPLPDRKSVV